MPMIVYKSLQNDDIEFSDHDLLKEKLPGPASNIEIKKNKFDSININSKIIVYQFKAFARVMMLDNIKP